jgi:hypothetical protein
MAVSIYLLNLYVYANKTLGYASKLYGAVDSCLPGREISHLLWNSEVHYHVWKSQINPVHNFHHISLRSTYSSCIFHLPHGSQDNTAGITTGYRLDNRGAGVQVLVGSRIFSSTRLPDQVWGAPSLLSSGYRDSFPGVKAAGAWSWPLTSN